jgi:hypothetical protein
MRGANIGRSNRNDFRIETELGKIPENTSKCSEKRFSVSGISQQSRL